MADAGGHGVDEYLEANFQLPEEVRTYACLSCEIKYAVANIQ
jgi:hypothetical protein